MEYYSKEISSLIEELGRLPGIGAKTAQRLAFHILHMPKDDVERLSHTLTQARQNVHYCKECFTLTDQDICPICAKPAIKSEHSTERCICNCGVVPVKVSSTAWIKSVQSNREELNRISNHLRGV